MACLGVLIYERELTEIEISQKGTACEIIKKKIVPRVVNKVFGTKFQRRASEECRSVQRTKRRKYRNKIR